MGCFWGAERKFWRQKGVYSTQVGYSGGYTPNPAYKEVCTGTVSSAHFWMHSHTHSVLDSMLKVSRMNHVTYALLYWGMDKAATDA